jgi:hypothetical protein
MENNDEDQRPLNADGSQPIIVQPSDGNHMSAEMGNNQDLNDHNEVTTSNN